MIKNMTEGNPIRLIFGFALPIMLSSIVQQFYQITDTMIVGQFVGVSALAAVGSCGGIITMVLGWAGGLTSGFSILISKSFGSRDYKRMSEYFMNAVFLCAMIAAGMTAVLQLILPWLVDVVNTPDELRADVTMYIRITFWGLAGSFLYNLLSSVQRAMGDSRTPLIFLGISVVANLGMDILFVGPLGMGVWGAALATILSQLFSGLLCLAFVLRKHKILLTANFRESIQKRTMGEMLKLGVPMALQFSITSLGNVLIQSALNALGTVYITAFTASSKIQGIFMSMFSSIGAAASTYVGQNTGAGKIRRVRQGVRDCQIAALIFSAVAMIFLSLTGQYLVKIFSSDITGPIQEACNQYFRLVPFFYPFLSAIFLYRNALQGMGYGFVPMLGGVGELAARTISSMVLAPRLGFLGICLGEPLAWIFALVPLVPYYFYAVNKWKRTEE